MEKEKAKQWQLISVGSAGNLRQASLLVTRRRSQNERIVLRKMKTILQYLCNENDLNNQIWDLLNDKGLPILDQLMTDEVGQYLPSMHQSGSGRIQHSQQRIDIKTKIPTATDLVSLLSFFVLVFPIGLDQPHIVWSSV